MRREDEELVGEDPEICPVEEDEDAEEESPSKQKWVLISLNMLPL